MISMSDRDMRYCILDFVFSSLFQTKKGNSLGGIYVYPKKYGANSQCVIMSMAQSKHTMHKYANNAETKRQKTAKRISGDW